MYWLSLVSALPDTPLPRAAHLLAGTLIALCFSYKTYTPLKCQILPFGGL
jgi:hypothetical protein